MEYCCTCLKTGVQFKTISEIDSKQIDYATKLRFCVPEVEWSSGHICMQCTGDLNQYYFFKEQCIKFNQVLEQKKINFLSNDTFSLEDKKPPIFNHPTNFSDNDSFSDNYVKIEVRDCEESPCKEKQEEESSEIKRNIVEDILWTETSQYTCSLCPNSYSDRTSLFLHKKNIHKEEQPYNCLHCDKVFKYSKELKRHEPIHSDNKGGFICDICMQTYNNSSVLSQHKIIKHTNPEEWKHICSHCDKRYPSKANLDQHIRRHHTNAGDTYICFHCNESYISKILLIAHIRFKHSTKNLQIDLENHMRKEHDVDASKPKQFPCEKCGKKYTTTKKLNMHARLCDGIKMHYDKSIKIESEKENDLENKRKEDVVKQKTCYLTCEFCHKIVGPHKRYVVHCVEEHGSTPETLKPYMCKECKERFSTSALLSRHRFHHAEKKTHICSFCGKGFNTRRDMLTHEKLHSNKREVQCEICWKRFHTKSHLRTHKLVVHTDPIHWKYVCPHCPMRRFPMKSNYDAHVRRHTGEKPFACHLCEKRFSDKVVLQKHYHAHSNLQAHKCDHCGKAYKIRDALNIHLKKAHDIGNAKIPTVVKKFVCDLCLKSFASRDKLRRHMCSHTGERPFACEICDKKFTDKSYVKQHLKSVHNFYQNQE